MRKERLSNACEFYSGTGFPNKYQGISDGKYPFYKVGDISRNIASGNYMLGKSENFIDDNILLEIKGKIVPPGTIVFAKIGEALRLNKRAITTQKCIIDNNVMGIKPIKEYLDLKYFYYYMQNLDMQRYSEATTVPSVKKSTLESIKMLIPDYKEQEKIAYKLDVITNLIVNRENALRTLESLVKSRFVELFGDPVTNPMKWKVKSLSELGNCKNGMNFHKGESGIDIHCLGVGDFQNLSVITDTSVLPIVSLNENPSEEYMLQDGDIVFVRSNGNKNLVGRCLTIYPHDIPTTFSGFCIRYRISKTDKVLTEYLLQVLKHESMRQKMTGRGANIQNLNQQILSALQIPLPPIDLQRQFIEFVELTDKSKLAVQQSIETLQMLKAKLMQDYFG
ncbi:restriction endonuclease subunit S [Selenomonas ruminantium]|uniref:Type I restriction enzyme, S subunit n=1 Tax=Selenomonas ruminantium TaxID=971 RepID=A0A1I0VAZ1_SELRU|nr:restriction endonuclease subunit S [Selenomonas ruminantium]SFA73569.1 type I restriction enzyme, S subunit [Selenomonas ruminantium]